MNRLRSLLSTDHVALSRFDHEPGCIHQDSREERSGGWTVTLVERGRSVSTPGAVTIGWRPAPFSSPRPAQPIAGITRRSRTTSAFRSGSVPR